MAQIRKREAAKRDLIAQWVWYAENAGVEIADRFLAAVESTAATFAEYPKSGIALISSVHHLQGLRRSLLAADLSKFWSSTFHSQMESKLSVWFMAGGISDG